MDNAQNIAARLASSGIDALRRGDVQTARNQFEKALEQQAGDANTWLGLAFACARGGDAEVALDAVNEALALEPLNLRALLFKGDHLTQIGRSRKALAAYKAALKLASREQQLPADIREGLVRAQQNCERFQGEHKEYLRNALQSAGYQRGHTRFDEAMDIAFGDTVPYLQQPTRFFYPGLAPITFFDTDAFPWIADLEAQTAQLRDELSNVLAQDGSFSPYLVSNADSVPINDVSNLDSDDWGAYYFYQQGQRIAEHAQACPATYTALQSVPLPQVPGSTPHALFSKLAAHSRIPPHTGLINTRLICHLPLIVPEDCGALRCGNATRTWKEGTALVFDDTIEHEAWNNSDADRVVLLFDLWRPELDAEERALIGTMLQAVGSYEDLD